MLIITADMLKKGCYAKVMSVNCKGELRKHLYALGGTPKAEIMFIRSAPCGDPLEFAVRDCRIAIRKKEAQKIVVEYDKTKWTKKRFL